MLGLKLKKYGSAERCCEYHVNNERVLMRMERINIIVYRVDKIVEISRKPNEKSGCENDTDKSY